MEEQEFLGKWRSDPECLKPLAVNHTLHTTVIAYRHVGCPLPLQMGNFMVVHCVLCDIAGVRDRIRCKIYTQKYSLNASTNE
jgi:hypothetical protein